MQITHAQQADIWSRRHEYHVLTYAETGFAPLTIHGRSMGASDDQLAEFAEQVNSRFETGSLYPRAPISVVPRALIRGMLDADSLRDHIIDFLRMNSHEIQARKIICDFRTPRVQRFVVDAIEAAIESVDGHGLEEVVILEADDSNRLPQSTGSRNAAVYVPDPLRKDAAKRLGDKHLDGTGVDTADERLFERLCKLPVHVDSYVSEWKYETDFQLTHISGLKISFEDRSSELLALTDPSEQRLFRSSMVGDTIADSGKKSRAYLMVLGLSELYTTLSTSRLFNQATSLFRNRPAGTPGAPERMSKAERLFELARKRQETWAGYRGIGEFHGGAYECDHVSPVTKTAGNLNSDILVLLQDWSSERSLEGKLDEDARDFGYTRTEPTFSNLSTLLRRHFKRELNEVYATNLFPFIKPGKMTQSIPRRDLVRAAWEFAIPEIEIVKPHLVICLGLGTFNALRRASGLRLISNLTDAGKDPMRMSGATVWSQAHTGYYGQITRNRGDAERVKRDWARMANWFFAAGPD